MNEENAQDAHIKADTDSQEVGRKKRVQDTAANDNGGCSKSCGGTACGLCVLDDA